MKKNKYTVSVGIAAHNEIANIIYLLQSIVRQQQEDFILEKVYVICDGTTDGTDKEVARFAKKFPVVHLVNDRKRVGKLKRVEQAYKMNTSDIICFFDGDVVLATPQVISNMVSLFTTDKIAIVGGNNQPVPATTLVGKLINKWSHIWYEARAAYNGGDNVHNIRGCGMAVRKAFAKQIKLPEQLTSESQYIYFFLLQKKMQFRFAKNAIIYYRKPTSLADYFSQFRRSAPESNALTGIFGKQILQKYRIPKRYSRYALAKSLLTDPFMTIAAALFTVYTNKFPYKSGSMTGKGVWKTVQSTKQGIQIDF